MLIGGGFGRGALGCRLSAAVPGGSSTGLKSAGFGVCLNSCCAPDQRRGGGWRNEGVGAGAQAPRLQKSSLFLRGELCGWAEVLWGPDRPTGGPLRVPEPPSPGPLNTASGQTPQNVNFSE